MDFVWQKAKDFAGKSPKRSPGSLRSRLMTRYASLVSVGDEPENKTEIHNTNELQDGKSLEHSDSKGSVASASVASINKAKMAALADLMTVFKDENECSSDQDDMIDELQEIGYFIGPKTRVTKERTGPVDFATIQKKQASSGSTDTGTTSDAGKGQPGATNDKTEGTQLCNKDIDLAVESVNNISISQGVAVRDKSTSDINSICKSMSNASFTTCTSGDLDFTDALASVSQTPEFEKAIRHAVEKEETAILTRTKAAKKDTLYSQVLAPKRTISAGILDLIESRRKPMSISEYGSVDSNIHEQPSDLAIGQNASLESGGTINRDLRKRISTISKRTGLYDVGEVEMTLQYLLVTNRLKIQILRVDDLANFSNSFSSNMFIQVSLMPGKMQMQTSKSVKSSTNPDFGNATFYFSGISLTDMHLMTVRVQVMQRKHLFKVPKCIAEMYVALDGIDLVGETTVRECLRM